MNNTLKEKYHQLWEQMAVLDQEWIRKHEELTDKQEAVVKSLSDAQADEIVESLPLSLLHRCICNYEVLLE